MEAILSRLRRCIEDYEMIRAGDRIAVGVSGGKDSLLLLYAMARLKRFYPLPFELHAITVHPGNPEMDFSGVAELCRELEVPYHLVQTEIFHILFDLRKEKNPCSLCAKMRRGAIHNAMGELGLNKIALGHHFDDAVTDLDRTGIIQIRPLLYCGEGMIRNAALRHQLPVVHNPCPADGSTRRQEVKELVAQLSKQYPRLKDYVFGAMQRLPLPAWKPRDYRRRPLSEE